MSVVLEETRDGRTAEEVVAGGDVGDDDRVLAVRGDEPVDGPARGVGVLEDLHPDWATAVGCCWGDVHRDWALQAESR